MTHAPTAWIGGHLSKQLREGLSPAAPPSTRHFVPFFDENLPKDSIHSLVLVTTVGVATLRRIEG